MVPLLAAVAIAPPPQTLLAKLLKTPVAKSELPFGFSKPRIAKQPLSANGIKYHAVGQVAVALQGPDQEDAFAWEVFKTRRDALADLHHPALANGVRLAGTVPGVKDGVLLRRKLNGLELADAVAVVGNVLVQAVTASPRGNPAAAVALLKVAIAHLHEVEGG
jgi:hypothetical protein